MAINWIWNNFYRYGVYTVNARRSGRPYSPRVIISLALVSVSTILEIFISIWEVGFPYFHPDSVLLNSEMNDPFLWFVFGKRPAIKWRQSRSRQRHVSHQHTQPKGPLLGCQVTPAPPPTSTCAFRKALGGISTVTVHVSHGCLIPLWCHSCFRDSHGIGLRKGNSTQRPAELTSCLLPLPYLAPLTPSLTVFTWEILLN